MEQIFIEESNFDRARKKINENNGKFIIFSSEDDELNRKILEKEKINVLLLNQKERKDFQKQRNSGLNQVLAKIAKKNNIIIGINLDELIKAEEKKKADIIARIRQNVKLCNKNKVKMKFISKSNKRNQLDLQALGLVLGMPTGMIKEL
jgi:ribonuclease P/MRP protein subunit RPP1